MEQFSEHGQKFSDFTKCLEFLDRLRNCYVFYKDSTAWYVDMISIFMKTCGRVDV
jgi:hypothetical protein